MNLDRRKLMKLLPMVAVAGTAVKLNGQRASMLEVNPVKQYVFKVSGNIEQSDLNTFRAVLEKRGFTNFVVITDRIDLYEIT